MVRGLFLALVFLAVLEGIAWFAYVDSKKKDVKLEETAQQSDQSKQSVPLVSGQAAKNTEEATPQKIENKSEDARQKESTQSKAAVKEFDMIGRQWEWEPSTIKVKQGDAVKLRIKSEDVLHGIVIPELGIDNTDIPAGETRTVEFVASKKGRFEFLCSTFCGDRHIDMTGIIVVE